MAFRYLHAKLSLLPRLFAPTIDALFSTIPLTHRWRLLLLQPINILSALITSPNWLFTNRYTVTYIPTRSGPRRCLVYQPLPRNSRTKTSKVKSSYRNPSLRPLHIDIHGGGFIGGFPELGARWLNTLSDATGAVIISCQYRIAPRYSYPAAHHDIDDIVTYILTHAQDFNADPNLVTVGGSSVGGSLAMSTSIEIRRRNLEIDSSLSTQQSLPEPKALLAFCPPTDYRLPAPLKPKPENFPKDPIPWVMPLYDTYPGPCRQIELWNKKLHPILAEREDLPERMFFVFAGIDILREEQRGFIERMCGSVGGGKGVEEDWQREGEGEEQVKYGEGSGVEWVLFEKGFHGWLELPSSILESERLLAFTKAIAFIKNVHREHGFDVDNL